MTSARLPRGIYESPRVRIGDVVIDEARGWVRVHDMVLTGALVWPRGLRPGRSPGRPALIVMGDLVRALRVESATAVANHWGVSDTLVSRWRSAVGAPRLTEGTRALMVEGGRKDFGPSGVQGAAALHSNPVASRKRAASHAETLRRKPGWREHMRDLSVLSVAARKNTTE